ncbi:hypothetical protein JCM5296_003645 [Sporobolomyces johnsonii]
MPSPPRRTLMRRSKTALLSTVSLASLANALVLPQSLSAPGAGARDLLHASSVRKTINLGPRPEVALHDADINPSVTLTSWNEQSSSSLRRFASACDTFDDPARCVGYELASSFVQTLHPQADFKLVDGVVSKHTGVFHAHFLQLLDGIPIANANLNVNVDLRTGQIVSYGDSSFAKAEQPGEWTARARKWAQGVAQSADQIIFGGSNSADMGSQGSDDVEVEYSSPPFLPTDQVSAPKVSDPRHGLITFLALQSTHWQLTRQLTGQPRSQLLTQLSSTPIVGTAHDVVIDGVPETMDEPVKATLTYIHDDKDVKLAWKYELKTHDNMYEAYMSADPSIAPGDEEAFMVVDWVRDFRPTGGELGFAEMYFGDGPKSFIPPTPRRIQSSPRKRWSWTRGWAAYPEETSARVQYAAAPVASTTDPKEVARLRKLKPSYKVFPWGVNAPDEGKRKLLQGTLVELDQEASPAGWHLVPSEYKGGKDTFYYETRGNNVLAQDNPSGGNSMTGFRANGGPNMTFDFPIHMTKPGVPLDPATYINASTTELFYTNNEIHDLFYRYGFDEESGNFQEHNFNRGGYGEDAVQANAQDGSGYNNANFATPPDGQRPRMRMYSWTASTPMRDGDFEAGIVIHEYSHGISTRLTGGPANSGCLGWGEAGGMGEGWGDFFATMIRLHDQKIAEYDMGSWASNRDGGIRNYRYSRNLTVNPDTYKSLDKGGYWGVHAIGEVWAEMLFELAENLMDKHGMHPTLFPPPVNRTDSTDFYSERHLRETGKLVPAHGNTLVIQLVVDAMKLQPCRPSFQNARDAIITADKVLTGGENRCIIWNSFAKRGLGPESKVVGSTPWGGGIRTEDYDAPKGCKTHKN